MTYPREAWVIQARGFSEADRVPTTRPQFSAPPRLSWELFRELSVIWFPFCKGCGKGVELDLHVCQLWRQYRVEKTGCFPSRHVLLQRELNEMGCYSHPMSQRHYLIQRQTDIHVCEYWCFRAHTYLAFEAWSWHPGYALGQLFAFRAFVYFFETWE